MRGPDDPGSLVKDLRAAQITRFRKHPRILDPQAFVLRVLRKRPGVGRARSLVLLQPVQRLRTHPRGFDVSGILFEMAFEHLDRFDECLAVAQPPRLVERLLRSLVGGHERHE